MAESIESFVKKLQSEGVDAGKQAAEKIIKEAKRDAEKILSDAKTEAEEIRTRAKTDADKELLRGQTELELAVRDALLKLRESISRALTTMLTRNIEKKLSDPDYLGEIIREVVAAYAKADAKQQSVTEINVSKKVRDRLNDNVLKDLFRNLGEEKDTMGLRATLAKAGFEYKIRGATVEVSADALSEMLAEMVSPALREIFDKFTEEASEKASKSKRKDTGEEKTPVTPDSAGGGKSTKKTKNP